MSDKTSILLTAAAGAVLAAPVAAQTPPASPPATPAVAPGSPAAQAFPPGAEVLSVEGEPLGVLAQVELRPGGERILHIRRTDGSVATAPAVVASRGERAVVLEWTREEFDSAAVAAPPPPPEAVSTAPSPLT